MAEMPTQIRSEQISDVAKVLRGILGPAYGPLESLGQTGAAAGEAVWQAFQQNPSEFAPLGGVLPAWRQAEQEFRHGRYVPAAIKYTEAMAGGLVDVLTGGAGAPIKATLSKGGPAALAAILAGAPSKKSGKAIKGGRKADVRESANRSGAGKKAAVPTEDEFINKYAAHKDIRSQMEGNEDVVMQSIMRHGFQDDLANALPPYRGGKPRNVIDQHYGPKVGDIYYIAPPGAWKDTPNGMRIRVGWKPKPHEIIRITEDNQSLYEAYIAGLNK
jgi:hypothetical protein